MYGSVDTTVRFVEEVRQGPARDQHEPCETKRVVTAQSPEIERATARVNTDLPCFPASPGPVRIPQIATRALPAQRETLSCDSHARRHIPWPLAKRRPESSPSRYVGGGTPR